MNAVFRWLAARAALLLALVLLSAPAAKACQITGAGELPVMMVEGAPFIKATINGKPALFLADTGSATSLIWGDGAARLGLPVGGDTGVTFQGVGGAVRARSVTIKQIMFGQQPVRNLQLFVLPSDQRHLEAGIIGQDIFSAFDVEFDLANGVIRLLKFVDCRNEQMVYWGKAYSQAALAPIGDMTRRDIGRSTIPEFEYNPHYETTALLNGRQVVAELDTGDYATMVSPGVAATAGLSLASSAVRKDGISRGIGPGAIEVRVARFATFSLGDETIRNAEVRIADLQRNHREQATGTHFEDNSAPDTPKMLIGVDFFRAHHVLVSNSHHMMFFSYNGGPVFDTAARRAASAVGSSASPEAPPARPPG